MKGSIKKYLVSGILVLVPVVFTVWVLKTLIVWLDGLIFSFLPHQLRPESLIGYNIPGVGLIVTFIIVLLAGIFTRLYIGKKFVKVGDSIFARLPFGRAIYQATKQVLHSTLGEKGQKARRVVLIEYPKSGSYAIGFLTGEWDKLAPPQDKEGAKDYITVFVPTTPNPTSGFLLIVPKDSAIPTSLSPEEASKLLISGGLLAKSDGKEVTYGQEKEEV